MTIGRLLGCLALAALTSGCGDDAPRPASEASDDAGATPSTLCPDPNNARVHYRDKDPNACRDVPLDCTVDQNGFNNRCGCGCIDKGSPLCPPQSDPAITFISTDPAVCGDQLPACPRGDTAFNNTCGCGCTRPGG